MALFVFKSTTIYAKDSLISKSQLEAIKKAIKEVDKAPDFSLSALDDSIYTLSNLKGKVVLINFWATWCGPCRMEIPDFNHIYDKYFDKGFEILGISISDNKKQLNNFTKSFILEYPVLYGTSMQMNKIMNDYGGIYSVPSSFLISKKGKIIWKYPGAILKEYDPQTYSSLIYEIEKELKNEEMELKTK